MLCLYIKFCDTTRCIAYKNVQRTKQTYFWSASDSEWHKAGASQVSENVTHINKSGYSSLRFLGELDSLIDWQIVL